MKFAWCGICVLLVLLSATGIQATTTATPTPTPTATPVLFFQTTATFYGSQTCGTQISSIFTEAILATTCLVNTTCYTVGGSSFQQTCSTAFPHLPGNLPQELTMYGASAYSGSGTGGNQFGIDSAYLVPAAGGCAPVYLSASITPPISQLGVAGNYALLAYSGITSAVSCTITGGNIGSAPTPATTTDFTLVSPAILDNADASAALAAASVAYAYYAALTPTLSGLTTLSTQGNGATASTYTAGVYVGASSLTMTTGITLDAQGNPLAVFVFIAGSTINLASGQSVTLVNGAQANNVVWIVGSSFTSVATSTMVGNILAQISITIGGGSLNGRAIAGIGGSSGAITISAASTVTVPTSSGIIVKATAVSIQAFCHKSYGQISGSFYNGTLCSGNAATFSGAYPLPFEYNGIPYTLQCHFRAAAATILPSVF